MAITYKIFRNERLIESRRPASSEPGTWMRSLTHCTRIRVGASLTPLYDTRYSEPDIPILQLAEVAGRVQRLLDRGVIRIAMVAESKTSLRMAKTFAVLAARSEPISRSSRKSILPSLGCMTRTQRRTTEETPLPS